MKELICPVCHEFKFTRPEDDEEIKDFFCIICGWEYNLNELTDENKLNKYREEFQTNRKGNPDWTYLNSIEEIKHPHTCPVCDLFLFQDENTHDICPYCGWEDDGIQTDEPDYEGGANIISLRQYKMKYMKNKKGNPNYKWVTDINNKK